MADDKSILYSCAESERINQLIQTQIAPHLFLVCNYAPSPYLVEGEDAKFVVGILNLYKFVVDGSIIDKIPNIMDSTMRNIINKKVFMEKINLVKALRTVYCHNESEISGNDDDVKKVNAWIQKIPQTIDDYRVLNQQLQKLASDIVIILHQFIKEASRTKQKAVLIENWEDTIRKFYQRPNTKNILVGQLKKFYSARKGISSMENPDIRDMASCVKKYYIGEFERELEKWENVYRAFCKKRSFSAEDLAKLRKKVEAAEEKLINEKKKIIARLGDGDITIDNIDRNDYTYLSLYVKELPKKIINIMDNTADTSVYGNLLPQNIVQYIVKQDFDLIIIR